MKKAPDHSSSDEPRDRKSTMAKVSRMAALGALMGAISLNPGSQNEKQRDSGTEVENLQKIEIKYRTEEAKIKEKIEKEWERRGMARVVGSRTDKDLAAEFERKHEEFATFVNGLIDELNNSLTASERFLLASGSYGKANQHYIAEIPNDHGLPFDYGWRFVSGDGVVNIEPSHAVG